MNELERAAMLLACGAVITHSIRLEMKLPAFTPQEVWGYHSEESRKFWRERAAQLLPMLDRG